MKKTFIALCACLSLAGCASVTQGTTQVISFSIDPTEAKCTIHNKENAILGTVTGKSNLIQVSKGAGDLIANCTAEGFENKTTRIISSTQTAGVIGIAVDFGIVDMLTGAMWKYPDHVAINMDRQKK
jgi:hypothetical protein